MVIVTNRLDGQFCALFVTCVIGHFLIDNFCSSLLLKIGSRKSFTIKNIRQRQNSELSHFCSRDKQRESEQHVCLLPDHLLGHRADQCRKAERGLEGDVRQKLETQGPQ